MRRRIRSRASDGNRQRAGWPQGLLPRGLPRSRICGGLGWATTQAYPATRDRPGGLSEYEILGIGKCQGGIALRHRWVLLLTPRQAFWEGIRLDRFAGSLRRRLAIGTLMITQKDCW